jgi:uncharacterized protein YbjT (DUF2867 family)
LSVLLVRANGPIGERLVTRLVEQDDEVRVVEPAAEIVPEWEVLGARVARGDDTDADLLERAAQNVRTLVLIDDQAGSSREVIEPVLEACRAAGVGRIVVFARRTNDDVNRLVEASDLEHVLMHLPRKKGLFGGPKISPAAIAEAIDAADDLAGKANLSLDLGEPSSWAALGLDSPV